MMVAGGTPTSADRRGSHPARGMTVAGRTLSPGMMIAGRTVSPA